MALNKAIAITPDQRKILLSLLARHLPNTQAWVYGSRVRGTSRPESDLDMVVFATREQAHEVAELRESFEESNLPFRVDLFVWNEVPESFRKQIEREHVVLDVVESFAIGGPGSFRRHGWTQLNLGRVCTKIGSGATPRGGKKAYVPSGPYALIRSQNVFNDGFRVEGLAHIGQQQASKLNNVEVAKDDVLLNITGDSVGRACQVRPDILPARVNQHVAIIRPDPGRLDPRFLRYALVAPNMQAKLLSWAGSGGTRNALTKGLVESLDVYAPPNVHEQRAIAGILGTLDDKIELNRRMNETLEAMARATFKDWFVDFGPTRAKAEGRTRYLAPELWDLFPDALDDEGKPVGWVTQPVNHLFEFNPRETLKMGTCAPYLDMAALPTSGLTPDLPRQRKFKSGSKYRDGDTLFARITPCLENGKTAFVFGLGDAVIGAGSTEFIVIRSKKPLPQAASYLLARDPEFRAHAKRSMTGTSGRQRANVAAAGNYEMTTPQAEGPWKALAALVEPLVDGVIANAQESRTLSKTRDLLLPKLMSGEFRLGDAEKVVEAVA